MLTVPWLVDRMLRPERNNLKTIHRDGLPAYLFVLIFIHFIPEKVTNGSNRDSPPVLLDDNLPRARDEVERVYHGAVTP